MQKKPNDALPLKDLFKFDNTPYFVLLLLGFLLPLFFVPSFFVSFVLGKSALVFLGVTISFIIFLIAILKSGSFELPKHPIFLSALSIPLVFLISAFFSSSFGMSIAGYGFEIGTVSFVFAMFVMLFLVSLLFRSWQKILYFYVAFLASFLLLAIFHALRFIFGSSFLSFGFFPQIISSTLGTWNDVGVFASASLVLTLVSFEMVSLGGVAKWLLSLVLVLSILTLIFVNLYVLWVVVCIFSLVFFVYTLSSRTYDEMSDIDTDTEADADADADADAEVGVTRNISYTSLAVLLVSIVFLLPVGGIVGNKIYSKYNISNLEVRPSWTSTIQISKTILKSDPVLGVGPNRFNNQWNLFRPQNLNTTPFWGSNFSYGVGLIPTFFTTTGILGFLVWVIFLLSFLFIGFKAIFVKTKNSFSRFVITSSFLTSLYLWVISIIYVPGIAITTLTFFFTGIFFASLYNEGVFKTHEVDFSKYPKVGFLSVMVLVIILVGTVAFGYTAIAKVVASSYLQHGLSAVDFGNLDKAESYITKSVDLDSNDIYLRALSGFYLLRLNNLVAGIGGSDLSEETKQQFQKFLGAAESNAVKAKDADPNNYENWLALGRVYDAVVPVGLVGAYENAKAVYEEALKLNPHNPSIILTFAQLEINHKDLKKAKEYIDQALAEKSDYADAIFVLSQIQVAEGNLKSAISSVETVALISPNDAGVFFQLGLLKYNNKDYQGAVSALERAVILIPSYSNARYFLGLSYDKLGKRTSAISQFEAIQTLNQDNVEVNLILTNLKAGRSAFSNVAPPLDNKPEKRSKLPVQDQ